MTTTAPRAPARSKICRLVDNHKSISRLIDLHPGCPRSVSHTVDALLIEAESIRDFYLNR